MGTAVAKKRTPSSDEQSTTTLSEPQEATAAKAAHALQIVESMPALAWSTDTAGRFTYVSPNAVAFLGSASAELLHLPTEDSFGWRPVVHPDEYEDIAAEWRVCIQTGRPCDTEHRLLRADGTYCWMRSSGRATRDSQGNIVAWHGVTIEIEEQKRAEAAMQEREHQLFQLVNMVPCLLCGLTPDGEPTFFNKGMIDFFGWDVDYLDKPGMSKIAAFIELGVHPDDRAHFIENFDRSIATGGSLAMKYRLRRSDGVYRWMDGRMVALRNEDGTLLNWDGVVLDVDDAMRALEAVRERERSLWQTVETLPAMIVCAGPDGEPVYRSQKLREFLGIDLEQFDGTGKSRLDATLDLAIHPDELADVKKDYAHSLATGEPYARRHRLRRFDGEYRWVETRAAPMRDDNGDIIQWNLICLDIDGEVRAQEELRLTQDGMARASQAASLAELSASIAHEVNQPLAAIVANSHACHRWLAAEPPNLERARVVAERIIRDANSAADVVSRIRALFKPSAQTRALTPPGSVIAEVHNLMVDEAMRRRIRLDVNVDADLPAVAIDRVQLQQVLLNLARNGMEAMDAVTHDRALSFRATSMDDGVRIEISDSGPGLEFPDRIFEPFFTTKAQGMGMGLAICRSIVGSHGGRLWAENSEPRGATFAFTLPVEAMVS